MELSITEPLLLLLAMGLLDPGWANPGRKGGFPAPSAPLLLFPLPIPNAAAMLDGDVGVVGVDEWIRKILPSGVCM